MTPVFGIFYVFGVQPIVAEKSFILFSILLDLQVSNCTYLSNVFIYFLFVIKAVALC